MFYAKKVFDNTPEFLKSEHYQNISCTVSDTGVKADEYGKSLYRRGRCLMPTAKLLRSHVVVPQKHIHILFRRIPWEFCLTQLK